MLLCGIPLEEPHIQWRLPVLAKEEKKSLKEGRLPIKESFYLMGTADPVGCLEEDEVCIIHENGQISGDVLVYRNPGIHFGDIRILKATHQKALEDIVGNSKYGIFFSTKGQRSIADKMAGGDYDGDMYWVSRNPELLRYFTPSEPWICTPSPSIAMIKKPTDFSADDLEHELFQLFLATRFQPSKSMGVAADSWLSYMDRMLTLGHECVDERNFLKEKMIRLVDIYYDALDAPKKGLKVEVPPDLIPKKYPHYMGKSDMLSYKSKSVLGEIFDKADELKLEEPSIRVWKLPNFEVEIPEARLRSWEDHYKTYRSEMTMALSISGESKKEAAGDVINKYKQVLYEADDFDKSNRSWEEIRLDALAVYHVTYDYAIKTSQAKYCGFAWKVAGAALLKAFIDKQDEKPVPYLAAFDIPLKMSEELTPAQCQKLMDDDRREELRKHLECELEEDHKKENKKGKKSKKRKIRVAKLPHPPEPKKPKARHLPSKSFGDAKNSTPLIPKRRSPPPTLQIPSKKKKLTAEEKGKYIAIEDSPQKTSIPEPQTKALVLGAMKPFKSTSTQASSERSLYPATPKARFPSFAASKGDDRTIICQQFLEWVPREEYEVGVKMDDIEAESYYMDMMVESAAKFAGMWRWATHHCSKAKKLEKNFEAMLNKAKEEAATEVKMIVAKELADYESRARSQASRANALEGELNRAKSRVTQLETQIKEDLRKLDEFQAELDKAEAQEEVRDSFVTEGYMMYSRLLRMALPEFDKETDWESEADKLHQWVEYFRKKELLEAEAEEEDDDDDGDSDEGEDDKIVSTANAGEEHALENHAAEDKPEDRDEGDSQGNPNEAQDSFGDEEL